MFKILFMIHDLSVGGAEKVLVNLVNNMDRNRFDITVMALFGGGVNEQFLSPHIRYKTIFKKVFPGNSHLLKIFTPKLLHTLFIKDRYDVEISYLEGPVARIISGSTKNDTKLVSWIHSEQHTKNNLAGAFRSFSEAEKCYQRFDKTIAVSQYVLDDFCGMIDCREKSMVLYNTIESDLIHEKAKENAPEMKEDTTLKIITVGTLKKLKGYDRLLRILKRLINEGYNVKLYILGKGPMEAEIREYTDRNHIQQYVELLGYKTNPYCYMAKADLFVCASYSEGFSTAATEALIVGVPVCTVDVPGMKEMLGENNQYGIVCANDENALYDAMKDLLDHPDKLQHYAAQAAIRGKEFNKEKSVKAVERMIMEL